MPADDKTDSLKATKPVRKTRRRSAKKAIKEEMSQPSFYRLVPNLLTIMAMAAGLSSIQFAIDGMWESAVIAILTAAVLDALDGAAARLLNAVSDFGAQLDSLSDFLAFGVAPSILLYFWILEESGKIGWIAMIVFAVATAMRLARYNVMSKEPKGVWAHGFFAGVPAPAGAAIALLPLFIWLMAPAFFEQFAALNMIVGLWVIFCAGMMVSRIPTWSTKQIHLPHKMAMPALAMAVLLIAAIIQAPWITLTMLSTLYLISILFSVRHFRKIAKEEQEEIDLADLALGVSDPDDHR
jgi:CDP-diacylglycerol--serine O-phosphatidyltransferase